MSLFFKKIIFYLFVMIEEYAGIVNVFVDDKLALIHMCPQNQLVCIRSALVHFGIVYLSQILDLALIEV